MENTYMTRKKRVKRNRELIESSVRGDRDAIVEFFKLNAGLVRSFILRSKPSELFSFDDAMSCAYIGYYNAIRRYDPNKLKDCKPESFVFSHVYAEIRKGKRHSIRIRENLDTKGDPVEGVTPPPITAWGHDSAVYRRALNKLYKTMSHEEKVIIKYRWFSKKEPYSAIALRCGHSFEYARLKEHKLRNKMLNLCAVEQ